MSIERTIFCKNKNSLLCERTLWTVEGREGAKLERLNVSICKKKKNLHKGRYMKKTLEISADNTLYFRFKYTLVLLYSGGKINGGLLKISKVSNTRKK